VDNCTVNEIKRWHGGPDDKPLMADSGLSTDKTNTTHQLKNMESSLPY
jgi:hypothetical protein